MSGRRGKVKWDESTLAQAFRLVAAGNPIRKTAKETGIPFSTLQERLKKNNKQITKCGRQTVFSKTQEAEMADQIKLLAKIFYGCTASEIKRMAYEYALKNNVPNNFNNATQMAGKDWLKGFMKRNNLSVRKAEGTSLNRAIAFNKDEVDIFFKLFGDLMEKFDFPPRNIFNVDETGITSVQDPGKIVAEKGQKRVGSITSGERGQTVTAVCAMSATGIFVPPMLIYPRQRHSVALEADGPRGALYRCSKNGWINEDLFVDWLKHFANHTKPSEKDPILLILDNHSSHISLKAYEFCKSNNIVMLSLPPHGSHRIQPMDVSIYGPFKTAYKAECNYFMKSHLGRKITPNDIASLFRKAFQKVATIPKAEAGFKAAGIYPYNPDVFTEEDFMAAEFLNSDDLIPHSSEHRGRDNKTPESQLLTDQQNNISVCNIPDDLILHSSEHREIDNKTPESQLITGQQNEISSPETVCNSPSLLNETTHDCPSNSFSMIESLSNLALERINSETFSSVTFATASISAAKTQKTSSVTIGPFTSAEQISTYTARSIITGLSNSTDTSTRSLTIIDPSTSTSATSSALASSFIGLPITTVKTTLASSSACTNSSSTALSITMGTSNFLSVSSSNCLTNVKDLLPVPKKSIEKRKSNRKQHATYITGTPFKETLIKKEERKLKKTETKKKSEARKNLKKEEKKQKITEIKTKSETRKNLKSNVTKEATKKQSEDKKRQSKVNPKGKKKTAHTVKKRILQEKNNTSSSSESDVEMTDLRKDDDTDIEENNDLENKCVLCDDYGRNNELWYRCVICGLWAHAECTGSDTPRNYMCDICVRKA